MCTANTIELDSFSAFSEPVQPTLHWLGSHRHTVLRLRDRFLPWQMRHFYYHHKTEAQLGAHFSMGVALGHLMALVLQGIAYILGLSFAFPIDILQAGGVLVPGLGSIARRLSLPRGKLLYQTGQPADEVMLLIEGYGRLCMEHELGRCLTVGLVAPGDLFGEEALLDDPERESAFETVLDSKIDIIPREAFTKFIDDNSVILRAVTEKLAQRILAQQRHMIRLAFEPLEQRLAWILLELATATGNIDSLEPVIPIYHKDLASLLGVWRETITATLNRWANDGLIVQQPGHIILKGVKELQKMTDDSSN